MRVRRGGASAFFLFAACACARAADPLSVVINEIAWAGTAASSSDEWIELHNPGAADVSLKGWVLEAADGSPKIPLSGVIAAGGYALLERSDDRTVADVKAHVVFTGSLANGPPGESLMLKDAAGAVVDQALFGQTRWPAGTGSPGYLSMERADPAKAGSWAPAWASNNGVTRNGVDADGGAINGTPGRRNAMSGGIDGEVCDNAVDDDADGDVDCGDDACGDHPACARAEPAASAGDALLVDPARNPFQPDSPNAALRQARLLFSLGDPAFVKRLRVLDAEGRLLRVLMDADVDALGRSWNGVADGEARWDGRDESGRAVPAGLYYVCLEAQSPSGRLRRVAPVAVGR